MIDAKLARDLTRSNEQILQEQMEYWSGEIESGIRKNARNGLWNYETPSIFYSELADRMMEKLVNNGFTVHKSCPDYSVYHSLKIVWKNG